MYSVEQFRIDADRYINKLKYPKEEPKYKIGDRVITRADKPNSYIFTVIGKDKVGIVKEISDIPLVDFGFGEYYVRQDRLAPYNY